MEAERWHSRHDTYRGAWQRAVKQSQKYHSPHAVFRTGDCFYCVYWSRIPDHGAAIIEELLGGKFLKRTFIL